MELSHFSVLNQLSHTKIERTPAQIAKVSVLQEGQLQILLINWSYRDIYMYGPIGTTQDGKWSALAPLVSWQETMH